MNIRRATAAATLVPALAIGGTVACGQGTTVKKVAPPPATTASGTRTEAPTESPTQTDKFNLAQGSTVTISASYGTKRVIQNSTVKIANGPLTCADAGRRGADKGLLNNPPKMSTR